MLRAYVINQVTARWALSATDNSGTRKYFPVPHARGTAGNGAVCIICLGVFHI